MKNKVLYVLPFIGILGLLLIAGCSKSDVKPFETMATGSTETGDVLIELTPYSIKNGKLEVDISANTHSVDLSQFDLKEITTLEINEEILKPISATTLAGHHSSGRLVFNLERRIDSYVIVIEGVPMQQNRRFVWDK